MSPVRRNAPHTRLPEAKAPWKWGFVSAEGGVGLLAWTRRGPAAVLLPRKTRRWALLEARRKWRFLPRGYFRKVAPSPVPGAFAAAYRRALAGKGAGRLLLDPPGGSPFHRRLWGLVRRIPRGGVLSYGVLAARAGSPRAVRAAGGAMARNPLPLFIPCHRVVAAGGIGGYSGGRHWKRKLLEREGAPVPGSRDFRFRAAGR